MRASVQDRLSRGSIERETDASQIGILIVSKIRLYRQSLESILRRVPSLAIVGAAEDHLEAQAMMSNTTVDVVLFDASNYHAARGIRDMVRVNPTNRILALGILDPADQVFELAEAGVSGYILADASVEDAIRAIGLVARGEYPGSTITMKSLRRAARGRALARTPHESADDLTTREGQVLVLIGRGFSNKEIGQELCIEVATVKNHVHNILHKLNLRRRSHAAIWLRRYGNALSTTEAAPRPGESRSNLDRI